MYAGGSFFSLEAYNNLPGDPLGKGDTTYVYRNAGS